MVQDEGDRVSEKEWVIVADDTVPEVMREMRDKYLTPGFIAEFVAESNARDKKREGVRKMAIRHGNGGRR
ncbi:hypothetical protein I3I95_09785 [bacterium]|nr:hypothetical protein [bacterium]